MVALNPQLTALGESASVSLADRVRELKAAGTPITGLQSGDPDFDTPQPIIEAAARAMRDGHTHYSSSRGLPALREAISHKIQAHTGVSYDPQREILVTHGAVHAYYTGLQAILSPGDEVLIPAPSWQTHANMVRVLRGVPVRIPGSPEADFLADRETWEAAVTERTRALVINTPNNPTGFMASRDYLAMLADFAEAHDLYIVSDEVYDHLVYDGAHHVSAASLPGAQPRTLLVNSFSKTYAMTGWRVGYLAAPEGVIDQALKASQNSITNLAPFIQHGAIEALTNPAVQTAVEAMVAAYTRRRDRVMQLYEDGIGETPARLRAPQGAFYFFIDMRALNLPDTQIAERLLNEAHVAVVPGSAYGEAGNGFVRATIAASDDDVERGFRAILHWAANAVE